MKDKVAFQCQSCGYVATKWLGKCPQCQGWNSFLEEKIERRSTRRGESVSKPLKLDSVEFSYVERTQTGIKEFDRVLGGGIVPGSLVLVGGDPGIGKSTLMLQVLGALSANKISVLYVSGEESLQQISLRARRLNLEKLDAYFLAETSFEKIILCIAEIKPHIIVVDSIQTTYVEEMESAAGSVGQVREVAHRFMELSKKEGISTFLVGHVTKEGMVAGPRVLEHLVDTVLYFEGEDKGIYRILRSVKNRFGSTNEIGVFEMQSQGLQEVSNPSQIFLSHRQEGVTGSAVATILEGTRPLLLEIQALTAASPLALPRRTALGVENQRVSVLVAVMERRIGIPLAGQDIYVNVAGGVKISEPSADLAILSAIASSYLNKPIHRDLVIIGEVGLSGEVRGVPHVDLRLKEAAKLGFTRAIVPQFKMTNEIKELQLEIEQVKNVPEIRDRIF